MHALFAFRQIGINIENSFCIYYLSTTCDDSVKSDVMPSCDQSILGFTSCSSARVILGQAVSIKLPLVGLKPTEVTAHD